MTDWIHKISEITDAIDGAVDDVRGKVARLLSIEDPIRILPYRGYGTENYLFIKGRILKDEGIKLKEDEPSTYDNIVNMYKRFATDEVPNARLQVRVGQTETEAVCNKEGYFNIEVYPQSTLDSEELWFPVDISLIEPKPQKDPVIGQAEVMIVRESAAFGVISDIDDTIVHTAATDLLKMIRIVYLGSAESRRPFQGVSDFYKRLQQGKSGQAGNPIFYVSSSAWNMYDVFARFMELNDIPKGPVFLKDIELSLEQMLSFEHAAHKREQIEPIFAQFQKLPFILIGDSGQKDPEIYSSLVRDYPDRVLGVFIRDVVPNDARRSRELAKIGAEVRSLGSHFTVFQETDEAAGFATQQGWI